MTTIKEQRAAQKRAMMERDADICKMYMEGESLEACSRRHKVTRQRVKQIVKKAGMWRPRSNHTDRGTFLGVSITEDVKQALRAEAERRGVSMSSLSADAIEEMLAGLPGESA